MRLGFVNVTRPRLYVAFTVAGVFDIGEFNSLEDAQAWAAQRYGEDLQAVAEQPTTTVDVVAEAPTPWLTLGAIAALFLFTFRGRHT